MEPSPFASKLTTNFDPTNEEILQVKDLLSAPTIRLQVLEQEIEELKARIEERKAQRSILSDEAQRYHRLISSPIHRITEDLLRRIFLHCLSTTHCPPINQTHSPILLTRICKSWRTIALSTPRLWASIHICIPTSITPYNMTDPVELKAFHSGAYENAHNCAEAARKWLERSGDELLDISMYCDDSDDSDASVSQVIVDTVASFSRRWKKLKLSCPRSALRNLEALGIPDVPKLESLIVISMSDYSFNSSDARIPLWNEFAAALFQAPRLRHVATSHMLENPLQLPVNWSQLTSLALKSLSNSSDPPTAADIFGMLKACPKLIVCRLELSAPRAIHETMDEIMSAITLPDLMVLRVHDSGNDITNYLLMLDLPSIQELDFYGGVGWFPGQAGTNLGNFLPRISSTLRKFSTDPQMFVWGDLTRSLRNLPSLTAISFMHARFASVIYPLGVYEKIDDNFLAQFTTPDLSGNALCPQLEEMSISEYNCVSDVGLLEFIQRKQSGTVTGLVKLRMVDITLRRRQGLYVKMDDKMQQLVKDSMNLKISYIIRNRNLPTQDSLLEGLPFPHHL